jgi:hypothetical protein
MANQAIKKQGGAKPAEAAPAEDVLEVLASIPAPVAVPVTSPVRRAFTAPTAPVASKEPACPTCKDTGRVIFVEQGRGLKSVGPCKCVKA